MNSILKLAGIIGQSITDGPGLRFTIFAQGCPHGCPGCHNPQTHSFEGGKEYTPLEILEMVKKNPLLKGVTFSGGEPMCQPEGFYDLACLLKDSGYEVACYTGYTYEELARDCGSPRYKLLTKLDILVDGEFKQELKSLNLWFKGSSNQRIIEVPNSLEKGEAVVCKQERWVGPGEK